MTTSQNSNRNILIGLIHLAFARLGQTDEECRDRMEHLTGKRSCKDLTDAQLQALVDHFRRQGVLEERQTARYPGGPRSDRPTEKQWATLAGLARKVGYDDLNDSRFATFVRRVAKVDNPRFLTRTTVSKVITGLQKWSEQKAAKTNGGSKA